MDDDTLRNAFAHGPDARPDAAFADALEERLRAAAAAPAPVVEMADAEEAPPNGERRRRVGWRAAVALGTAAAVVAALVVIRQGTHTSSKTGFTLGDIAKAMVGTAHFETTFESTYALSESSGSSGAATTSIAASVPRSSTQTMTGEIDFTHHASRSVARSSVPTFAMSSGLAPTTTYRNVTTEMLSVDGVQYEGIDLWLAMFQRGVPASLHGKKWVRIDRSGSKQQSTATTNTVPSTSASSASGGTWVGLGGHQVDDTAQGGNNDTAAVGALAAASSALFFAKVDSVGDPAAIVDLLRKDGATLTAIGSARVRGVAVQRYRVTMRKPAPGTTIEVDVDAQGRLRRWIVHEDLAAQYAASPKPYPANMPTPRGSIRMQTDLFDFGVPVHISPPPASEVATMEQLKLALQQLASAPFGSAPKSSTPAITPNASGPTKLTTPWHIVASGTTSAGWQVYAGAAPGWTCYRFGAGTVDAGSVTAPVGGGIPTVADGKPGTCFRATDANVALLGEITGARPTLVGVAPRSARVTVGLRTRRVIDVPVNGTVFAWTGTASDVVDKLTVADPADKPLLSCTTIPGIAVLTCDPSAQSFVVGQPSP